jgi:hypothetical protein
MAISGWVLLLAATLAAAQEPAPFPGEQVSPWRPAWELRLRADRISDPEPGPDLIQREDLQLRLRWNADWGALHLQAGTRSALGSDGNRFNAVRYDQQPSNGTQLDMASLKLTGVTAGTFGVLCLGFQGNGLLVSQALWDRDLRFLGAEASAGVRSAGGLLQEAGLRAEAGRVRTLLGGEVDLAAGQAVVKLDTGPLSWNAHAGRWNLSWTAGEDRLSPVAYGTDERQHLSLGAWGGGVKWNSTTPLELRWFQSRNLATAETSVEFQVIAGSRERAWRPQFMFTWQRLSDTGTLYPVNGDEWWYYRGAKGPRLDLSLPLAGQWLATLTWLRQSDDQYDYPVQRRMLSIVKRF